MSASSEKRRRQDERLQGTEKRQVSQREAEEKARKSKKNWTIGGVLIVLLVAVIFILNSNLLYQLPAMTVENGTSGGTTYSAAEVKYYYNGMYQNIAAYGLVSTSIPLDEQECTYLEDGGSWDDYIKQEVTTSLMHMQAVYDQAVSAGYTISEDGQAQVEETMQSLQSAADNNNMSLRKFIRQYYGMGVTPKLVEKLTAKSVLVTEYEQSMEDGFVYTDEELDTYFDEHIADYRTYDYLYYFVEAKADEPEDEEGTPAESEDGTTPVEGEDGAAVPDGQEDDAAPADTEGESEGEGNETDEPEVDPAVQEAIARANAMAAYVTDEESFAEAVNAYVEGDEPQRATDVAANQVITEWITEEGRAYGQTAVASGDNGAYVVMFLGSNDQKYNEVSVRHILVKTEDTDEDGSYSDEELAAAKEKAEELLAEWEAGEKTEESFAALANEHSEDDGSNTNGGLYENVYQGAMVQEFNDFCFAEGRKPGDTGIVHGNNGGYDGYHVMYFVGANGPLHSRTLAKNDLVSADLEEWESGIVESYTSANKFGMRLVRAGM